VAQSPGSLARVPTLHRRRHRRRRKGSLRGRRNPSHGRTSQWITQSPATSCRLWPTHPRDPHALWLWHFGWLRRSYSESSTRLSPYLCMGVAHRVALLRARRSPVERGVRTCARAGAGGGGEQRARATRPDAWSRTNLAGGAPGRRTLDQEAPARSTTEKRPPPTPKVRGVKRTNPARARGSRGVRRPKPTGGSR